MKEGCLCLSINSSAGKTWKLFAKCSTEWTQSDLCEEGSGFWSTFLEYICLAILLPAISLYYSGRYQSVKKLFLLTKILSLTYDYNWQLPRDIYETVNFKCYCGWPEHENYRIVMYPKLKNTFDSKMENIVLSGKRNLIDNRKALLQKVVNDQQFYCNAKYKVTDNCLITSSCRTSK